MPKPSHRDKLIQSALAVFHEFGFHATSVQHIVDHAGVPKGSFYNHFKSKDALGLEILDVYWDQYQSVHAALTDTTVPALERINAHLAAFGDNPSGCLIGNFSAEMANSEVFRDKLKNFYANLITGLATCIEHGQKDGSIRQDDSANGLAEFVITGLEGAILKRKVDQQAEKLIAFRATMMKFLTA